MKGIITKGIGGFYYVKAEDGAVYECKARGVFRKDRIKPMIGDRVEIAPEDGSIVEIYPRRTTLIRPAVANIDALMLVVATTEPDPNLRLIDKMLITAELNHIKPAICLNKIDRRAAEDLCEIYAATGYPIFEVSAQNETGIEALLPFLKGQTTAFAGLSGVGKSSILNLLTDHDLETGTVSERILRGKHTTRHVELFELSCGGFVLDTPGFSSFEVENIRAQELEAYFPEFSDVRTGCRFKGCSHINEPDCAVKEKLGRGEIATSRYESYVELYKQLQAIKEWEN